MQKLATARGGKCLSNAYVRSTHKLRWECAQGHSWEASPGNVKNRGSWCPECKISLREAICRTTFEQLFGVPFPKSRPEWLRSAEGQLLEFDGFNETLRIAFEHQGEQHFRPGIFSTGQSELNRRQALDELKRIKCLERSIALIEVNYWDDLEKLPEIIETKLTEASRHFPEVDWHKEVDFNAAYVHVNHLKNMQAIAVKKGGKLLSERYLGSREQLNWSCAEGHTWWASPHTVKSGHWCNRCAGHEAYTLDEVREMARSRGGKCLALNYKNNKEKLPFVCAYGHTWETTSKQIAKGTWCPKCGGTSKYTEKDLYKLALDRDFKYLSGTSYSAGQPVTWECPEGHQWAAVPAFVKAGSGCPYCAGKHLSIEDCISLVAPLGGTCLSTEYRDSTSMLQWRCKEGHVFERSRNKVQGRIRSKAQYCPDCHAVETNAPDISRLHEIAASRGGRCFAISYLGVQEAYGWECAHGHRWSAKPADMKDKPSKKGSWCPHCISRKLGINDAKALALAKGGICRSDTWKSVGSNLTWECAKGHTWEAPFNRIEGRPEKAGSWCPKCSGHRVTISDCDEFARLRGGRCLSTQWKGNKVKMRWQCQHNHEWDATWRAVTNYGEDPKSWCPQCSGRQKA